MAIRITVNGKQQSVDAAPDTPLLYALRNDLELNGAKFGCGLAQCGACTVIIDGKAVRSCVTPLSSVAGKAITTIEGLGTSAKPHALQQAFVEEQATQCGYCASGMIMTAKVLLDKNPRPTEAQMEQVKFDRQRVLTQSWADYPILTFAEVPAVEVVLLNHPDERPLGVGEGSQGPTAAAISNAIANATGKRLRDLPFLRERVKAALV